MPRTSEVKIFGKTLWFLNNVVNVKLMEHGSIIYKIFHVTDC